MASTAIGSFPTTIDFIMFSTAFIVAGAPSREADDSPIPMIPSSVITRTISITREGLALLGKSFQTKGMFTVVVVTSVIFTVLLQNLFLQGLRDQYKHTVISFCAGVKCLFLGV
jgi:hypothetical protein